MPAIGRVKTFDMTPATLREDSFHRLIPGIRNDGSLARHRSDEMVKLSLDRREIGKNIGMIEFEIIQDGHVWPIMDELRPLVEERRVVLVGFDDKRDSFTH